MRFHLKNIAGGLILFTGFILFFVSLLNNNINNALVALACTLIFWVLFGLLFETFDIHMFSWVISLSGFLLSISIFFLYGVEEVAHPVGAIVFHSGGIAGSLGIGLFSLFPILILYQINSNKVISKTNPIINTDDEVVQPNIDSDDWEIATDDDVKSDKFEMD